MTYELDKETGASYYRPQMRFICYKHSDCTYKAAGNLCSRQTRLVYTTEGGSYSNRSEPNGKHTKRVDLSFCGFKGEEIAFDDGGNPVLPLVRRGRPRKRKAAP